MRNAAAVAWLYQSKINPNLPEYLTRQPPDRVIEPDQFVIQPLYTTPPDAATQIAELQAENFALKTKVWS